MNLRHRLTAAEAIPSEQLICGPIDLHDRHIGFADLMAGVVMDASASSADLGDKVASAVRRMPAIGAVSVNFMASAS